MNSSFDINNICEKCYYDPKSHSFHNFKENYNEVYFYTCHADAKNFNDVEGISKCIRLELDKINKEWIWIYDCVGF